MYVYTILFSDLINLYSSLFRCSINLSSKLARIRFYLSLFYQLCHNGLWSRSRRDSRARGWTWQHHPLRFWRLSSSIHSSIHRHRQHCFHSGFLPFPFLDVLLSVSFYILQLYLQSRRVFSHLHFFFFPFRSTVSIYKNWIALHRLTASINRHVFTDIVTSILPFLMSDCWSLFRHITWSRGIYAS